MRPTVKTKTAAGRKRRPILWGQERSYFYTEIYRLHRILVGTMPHKGRYVMAWTDIAMGETVESCLTILVGTDPESDALYNQWAYEYEGQSYIALGAGSLYNHSVKPNARWYMQPPHTGPYPILHIVALRSIAQGEEITISYGPGIHFPRGW